MDKYLIVVEKSETGYSAYSPDVTGCIATGKTIEKTIASMKTALAFHLSAMAEDGEALPAPRGIAAYLEAVSNAEGEEYFLTHIAVGAILPEIVHA
ncbi:MAG: type II toxin-antitoxin system HicB family antitoxin [Chloroflexi bacterium]|nr:type II toxin-antitoxin system HicB family antitoxin [Chloroflexota bacterium]